MNTNNKNTSKKINKTDFIENKDPKKPSPMSDIITIIRNLNLEEPWLQHVPSFLRDATVYEDPQSELADILNKILTQETTPLEHKNNKENGKRKHYYYSKELKTGNAQPLKFVPQSALDNISHTQATAYETFVATTGNIPTRNNLHDFFNAFVWLTFPKTKAILNKYQAQQIANDGISGSRGRVRDAITVFDENGAILITSDESIGQSLKAFDWQNTLVQSREDWTNPAAQSSATPLATTMLMICGHALMEQLVTPHKSLCAHTFILHVPTTFFDLSMIERVAFVDTLLTEKVDIWLKQDDVSPRQLSPLPVLGVPHYWADNNDKDFYNDSFVFRAGRRKK